MSATMRILTAVFQVLRQHWLDAIGRTEETVVSQVGALFILKRNPREPSLKTVCTSFNRTKRRKQVVTVLLLLQSAFSTCASRP